MTQNDQLGNLGQIFQAQPDHVSDTDLKVPIYNVWTPEAPILDNLLYAYTEPLDTVFDAFAGDGSTIDVCKRRLRRYYVSDSTPTPEREHEIRHHDIPTGLPSVPRWEGVKLAYLNPPKEFYAILPSLIADVASKLQSGSHIALVIEPSQWDTDENHTYVDHLWNLAPQVNLPLVQRIQAPRDESVCTPEMVTWAQENREWLVLSREIVVWGV